MNMEGFMRTHHAIVGRSVVWLVVVELLQPRNAALATMRQAPKAHMHPAATAPDGGWPRRYVSALGERIVLYDPQVARWDDQKVLTLHAAVGYSSRDGQTPFLGTVIAEATTRVSVAD